MLEIATYRLLRCSGYVEREQNLKRMKEGVKDLCIIGRIIVLFVEKGAFTNFGNISVNNDVCWCSKDVGTGIHCCNQPGCLVNIQACLKAGLII